VYQKINEYLNFNKNCDNFSGKVE